MVVLTKKPKTFEIEFRDPSKASYRSGDKVAGRVVVEVSEVTIVKAVRLYGVGCAKVEYHKGKQRCRDEIDYLKYEEVLHLDQQPTDMDGSITLRPGNTYEYMFGFELPQPGQLASSYKGKFGSVEYYVKAVMERPSQSGGAECKKCFEVEEPVDINTLELTSPATGAKEKRLTCMFIPDGSVSITAQINRKGFCEGEEISIDGKFENSCSRIVVPKAAIIATHTYLANGRRKVFREKISAVRGNHIISGMCDLWQGKSIRVPRLKPTVLGCNIIHLDYTLMVYMHIPGSEKLILELPLVIGTIPFNGLASRTCSMSSQDGSAASSSTVSMPSAPPSYSEIPRVGHLDSPLIPLLDDYDEDDCPIFMNVGQYHHTPPPAYTEVGENCTGINLQLC
ncbi:thioredoxin-interacting protein [Astyanax mexicanus]|uniref:Thioredoxin-interacting protein n=2 Tax=Astyanax mexicanus TaxID=7994 RepID=A0A8B9JCD1_ASTMX|nr:thioredoxin-interacting protein [Astyanax mexicanus]